MIEPLEDEIATYGDLRCDECEYRHDVQDDCIFSTIWDEYEADDDVQ